MIIKAVCDLQPTPPTDTWMPEAEKHADCEQHCCSEKHAEKHALSSTDAQKNTLSNSDAITETKRRQG